MGDFVSVSHRVIGTVPKHMFGSPRPVCLAVDLEIESTPIVEKRVGFIMIIHSNKNESSMIRVDLSQSRHNIGWNGGRDFGVVVQNVCHEVVTPSLDGDVLYKIHDRYEIRKDIRVLERTPSLVVGSPPGIIISHSRLAR